MCIAPNRVKNVHGFTSLEYVFFPCGKCFECRKKFIRDWFIRWNEEININYSDDNERLFITLTYNDDNLVYTKQDDGSLISTLNYKDVQDFIKRLRIFNQRFCEKNNIALKPVKYQYSGEYGNNGTKRPHYHLFICGLCPSIISEIPKIWKKGIVDVKKNADVNTVKYIVKYSLKSCISLEKTKIYNKLPKYVYRKVNLTDFKFKFAHLNPNIKKSYNFQKGKFYEFTNRVAEKCVSSKNIGSCYLTEFVLNQIKSNVTDYKYSYFDPKFKKFMLFSLPRYYWKKVLYQHVTDIKGNKMYYPNGTPVLTPNVRDEDFASTLAGIRFYHYANRYMKECNDLSIKIREDPTLINKIHNENVNYNSIEKLKIKRYFSEIINRENFDNL